MLSCDLFFEITLVINMCCDSLFAFENIEVNFVLSL